MNRRTTTKAGGHHVVDPMRPATYTDHWHLVDDPTLDDLTADMSWWQRPVPWWVVLAWGPLHGVLAAIVYGWLW